MNHDINLDKVASDLYFDLISEENAYLAYDHLADVLNNIEENGMRFHFGQIKHITRGALTFDNEILLFLILKKYPEMYDFIKNANDKYKSIFNNKPKSKHHIIENIIMPKSKHRNQLNKVFDELKYVPQYKNKKGEITYPGGEKFHSRKNSYYTRALIYDNNGHVNNFSRKRNRRSRKY